MSCPVISEICSSCRYICPQVRFRIDKQSPLRTIYSKSFPTQNNRTIFPKPSPAQSHLSKSSPTQTTEPSYPVRHTVIVCNQELEAFEGTVCETPSPCPSQTR